MESNIQQTKSKAKSSELDVVISKILSNKEEVVRIFF